MNTETESRPACFYNYMSTVTESRTTYIYSHMYTGTATDKNELHNSTIT